MIEGIEVEVAAQLAIDPDEQIAIECSRHPKRIVIREQKVLFRLHEISSEENSISRDQGSSDGSQKRLCPRAIEISNVRSQKQRQRDTAWFAPFMETWTRTKLPWVSTSAVRSYEEYPPADHYETLIREFSTSQQG